jgi:hypothetical protein
MAEAVGTRQGSPLRCDEREKAAPLTEPASPLPAAQDMKRGHSTKEIWLRQTPSFKFRPSAGSDRRANTMPYTSSNTATTTAPHSKNAALGNRSESPYQQRTTQKDNPTQQLIKQAVDFLLQQLEAGKSETLTAYLAAMARFHSYSFLCCA